LLTKENVSDNKNIIPFEKIKIVSHPFLYLFLSHECFFFEGERKKKLSIHVFPFIYSPPDWPRLPERPHRRPQQQHKLGTIYHDRAAGAVGTSARPQLNPKNTKFGFLISEKKNRGQDSLLLYI
jgi:hypothetical protein